MLTAERLDRASLASRSALAVVVLFVVSRIALLFFHLHHGPNLKEYRQFLQFAAAGQRPFVDFPIEFPPLAWWVMQLPHTTAATSYGFRFRLLMGLADVLSFALLWWIARTRRPPAAVLVAGMYVAATVLQEYVLYDSLDMLMLLCVLAGLAAWLRGATSARPGLWRCLAYTALAVGTTYRVIPGFAFPPLVVGDLCTERRWRWVVARCVLAAAVMAIPFAVEYRAGIGLLGFVQFQSRRGIEIGSIWASLMWLVSRGDASLHVADRVGTLDLSGTFEFVFLRIAAVSSVAALAMLVAWALTLRGPFAATRAYVQVLLALPLMLLVSRVFSVQYLLWAVPLMMLASLELIEDRRELLVVAGTCLVMAGLTTAYYPLGLQYLTRLNPWVMAIIVTRNALLTALLVRLVALSIGRTRGPCAAQGA
jgi:hypothetical protein